MPEPMTPTWARVVDSSQLEQDLRYREIARTQGAEVVGGEVLDRARAGHYLSPALAVGTTITDTINTEVFGRWSPWSESRTTPMPSQQPTRRR